MCSPDPPAAASWHLISCSSFHAKHVGLFAPRTHLLQLLASLFTTLTTLLTTLISLLTPLTTPTTLAYASCVLCTLYSPASRPAGAGFVPWFGFKQGGLTGRLRLGPISGFLWVGLFRVGLFLPPPSTSFHDTPQVISPSAASYCARRPPTRAASSAPTPSRPCGWWSAVGAVCSQLLVK